MICWTPIWRAGTELSLVMLDSRPSVADAVNKFDFIEDELCITQDGPLEGFYRRDSKRLKFVEPVGRFRHEISWKLVVESSGIIYDRRRKRKTVAEY